MKKRQPNIIYIHTHDTGRFIEPYGYGIRTPHLSRFAETATLFRNAHCAGPTCSPSRAALLSGMSPHSAGMLGLAHRGFSMNDYGRHLAPYLARHGYHTALSGVQHEASDPSMIGYGEIIQRTREPAGAGDREEIDRYVTREDLENAWRAAAYIGEQAGKDEPFFLAFGMFATHREFPSEHPGHIRQDALALPPGIFDNHRNRADFAGFCTAAEAADRCAGIVLDALERSGLRESSVVFYTTDHGIAWPGYKCTLTDRGTGVALIMDFPGNPARGKALDSLVSQIDLFPTLCELAGVPEPAWTEGKNMMPLFRGEAGEINEEIYGEVTYHAAYEPKRTIRTRRYRLERHFDENRSLVPANIDDSPAKTFLVEHGYLERVRREDALYDLALDPAERRNLFADPAYREVREDLSARLIRWMERTADPLLGQKRVAKPSGAVVNRQDCLSPKEVAYET